MLCILFCNIYRIRGGANWLGQWRSEGGRSRAGGARRQNPVKYFFKIYIRRNFKNSERIK